MNNPVGMALRDLSNTARSVGTIGDSRLNAAKFLTDTERQAELDRLNRPALELNNLMNAAKLKEMQSPVTMGTIFPNIQNLEHAFWKKENTPETFGAEPMGNVEQYEPEETLYQKIANTINADVDIYRINNSNFTCNFSHEFISFIK